MSEKQDVLIVMTHGMKIKELEARQNALQEEMEPRRNACLMATQKFNALMEDYQNLSSKISFLTEEQSKVREEVNRMSDKASNNGFYNPQHLEMLLESNGAAKAMNENFKDENVFLTDLVKYLRDDLGVISTPGPTGEISPCSKILNELEARLSKNLSNQSELVIDRMNVEAEIYEERQKPQYNELNQLKRTLDLFDTNMEDYREKHTELTQAKDKAEVELNKAQQELSDLIDEEKSVGKSLKKLRAAEKS